MPILIEPRSFCEHILESEKNLLGAVVQIHVAIHKIQDVHLQNTVLH